MGQVTYCEVCQEQRICVWRHGMFLCEDHFEMVENGLIQIVYEEKEQETSKKEVKH